MARAPSKRTKNGIEIRGDSISHRFYVKDPTHPRGRREIRRSGFATVKEAEQDRREQLLLRDKGVSVLPNNLTVSEYFPDCLEAHFKTQGLRPQSQDDYRVHLNSYILPNLGNLKLIDCTTLVLEKFLLDLRTSGGRKSGKPLSSSTVEKIGIVLKIGFKSAVRQRILALNPMSEIRSPRSKSEEVSEIDSETLRLLASVWRDERLGHFFEVKLALGARRGELLALRWSDLDFDSCEVKISKTRYTSGKTTYENAPKSRTGYRTISLTLDQMKLFREWKVRQNQERLKAGELWKEGDFVFTNEFGEPLSASQLQTVWTRILRTARVKGIHLHSLRHTHISALLRLGVPPHTVAKRAGDTVETILRTYAHSKPQDDKKAAEAFERLTQSL